MKLVYVGDASNNVAASLMLLAPRLGTHLTLACPTGYEPKPELVEETRAMALANNTRFDLVSDPLEAADDADVLYTDVWTSMGQEQESEKRLLDFAGFQINDEMVREAKEDVFVLHCLPAHRGHEIASSVLDGPQSGVFDQAENRLHVQMALLAAVL
jgi:ornithine carbamoyltransferase